MAKIPKDRLIAFRVNGELADEFDRAAETREKKSVPEKLRDLMAQYVALQQ